MSIHRGRLKREGWPDLVETAGGKFKYSVDLLPRNVELVNDFFYGGSSFKVLEYGRYGHTGITKHPCAA